MTRTFGFMSAVDWWGVLFATLALALFFALYNFVGHPWFDLKFRKQKAAPSGHQPLGGKPYWRHRIEILPLVVVMLYLGTVCSFVDSKWFLGLAVWWYLAAATMIWIFWVRPGLKSLKHVTGTDDPGASDGQSVGGPSGPDVGGFPKGNDADYVVVSPYEKVDSGQRPWWKPRPRN